MVKSRGLQHVGQERGIPRNPGKMNIRGTGSLRLQCRLTDRTNEGSGGEMELSMALQGRGGPAVSGDRGRSFDPMPMNHYLPPPASLQEEWRPRCRHEAILQQTNVSLKFC